MKNNVQAPATTEGPNLSRQQKNMLLMRPLYEIALTARPTDDAGEQLFAGLDTNLLCLSLLDYVMEGSVFDFGRVREDVVAHLATKARRMKPELTVESSHKVASKIIDGLHNTANMTRPFEYDYFDSTGGEMKRYVFQLLRYTRSDDDRYCYRVTEEGYLVYLGMLDISSEDMQVFLDKLLIHLIQRGKVDEALHISERSRRESLRYREGIREQLGRAQRSPESVSWRQDIEPFLDQSRTHIDGRKKDGRKLESIVRGQTEQAADAEARTKFLVLSKSLDDERKIGLRLLDEVSRAGDTFRWASRKMFTARRRQSLPDIEDKLLPPLLGATVTQLADICNEDGHVFLSIKREKQFFLGDMVGALTVERNAPTESKEDIADVVAVTQAMPHFDERDIDQAVDHVNSAVRSAFSQQQSITSEAIIQQAEDAKLSEGAQEFALHLLYRLFAYPEPGMKVVTDGRFVSRIANAAKLIYSPTLTGVGANKGENEHV